MFLNIFSQAEKCEASECSRTVSGLVLTFRQSILKLREDLRRNREVVLRAGFSLESVEDNSEHNLAGMAN